MAEFPELGVHCSLETCNKLDFFPFCCKSCRSFFCSDHRFEHPCRPDESQLVRVEKSSSGQLKKHLCSKQACFTFEFAKLECSQCGRHFCMAHRQCEDHDCEGLRKETKPTAEKSRVEIGPAPTVKAPKKHKDPAQQALADRVAAMRLKSRNPFKISREEALIVFVNLPNDDRLPCMISSKWTVNRSRTAFIEQCKLPNDSDLVLHTSGEDDEPKPLDIETSAGVLLADMADVWLLPKVQ